MKYKNERNNAVVNKLIAKLKKANLKPTPKEYHFSFVDEISDFATDSEVFYNVPMTDEITLPMVMVGQNGVYVFVDYGETADYDHLRALRDEVIGFYGFDAKTSVWAISEGSECMYLVAGRNEIYTIDDITQKFMNYYRNKALPEVVKVRLSLYETKDFLTSSEELKKKYEALSENSIIFEDETYIKPEVEPDMVEYYIEKIDKCYEPEPDKDTYVNEDGVEFHKHTTTFLGLATGEAYFRMSDEEQDIMYLVTLFGGIFGLHHFMRGNFLKGILYLLTGGGFGVLYLADVLQMCNGSYSYYEATYGEDDNGKPTRLKEKVYTRPLSDKRLKYLGIPVGLVLGVCMTLFVILPVYQNVNQAFADKSSNLIITSIEKQLDNADIPYSD